MITTQKLISTGIGNNSMHQGTKHFIMIIIIIIITVIIIFFIIIITNSLLR